MSEQALKDVLPQLFESVIENINEGVVVYTDTGIVAFANQKACEILGYDRQQLVGQSGALFVCPEDLEIAHQYWLELLEKPGGAIDVQQRIVKQSGELCWIGARLKNCLHNPVAPHIVSSFSDISALRNLESQFRQSQRLEIAGQMSGRLAHELNNFLTIMLGGLDLLLHGTQDAVDTDIRDNLTSIINAGEKAGELSNRFLAFSSNREIDRKGLNINSVISEYTQIAQQLLPDNINLRFQNQHDPASMVLVDPVQLQQVIANLIANARDAIGQQRGRITLKTQSVTVKEADLSDREKDLVGGDYELITVSDTGGGIPDEIREKLFNAFFTTKSAGKGSGLGLAIVQEIVTENRGFIRLLSKLGQGSTFEIYLPRYYGEEVAEHHLRVNLTSLTGSGRILVVDDDQGVLNFIDRTLKSFGYEVISACSFHQAVSEFVKHKSTLDLCIIDNLLADDTGLTLAETLRKQHTQVPLLIISGYKLKQNANPPDAIDPFLLKPFGVVRLGDAVKRLLE